ncbi:MAG: motility-associated protein, partial [Dongia sp.]
MIVIGCVAGGYLLNGGHFGVLIQTTEFLIILGAAAGSFIIGNTKTNLKAVGAGLKRALKGPTYHKKDYVELLSLLYQVFRLAKTKGMLALEQHVDKPDESALFAQFPNVQKNH